MAQLQPQGFLASPLAGTGASVLAPACLVGLNGILKAFRTQLAEAGYVAFAPDLHHGQVADTFAEAETLGAALDTNFRQAKAEMAQAATLVNSNDGRQEVKRWIRQRS